MRRTSMWLWCSLSLALACGGPSSGSPAGDVTAGGEGDTAARPSGPPSSFLGEEVRVVARLDMARVRRSPLATDLGSAIRGTEAWQRLAGTSGVDPVADFDFILLGADALYTDRRVAVLRTPHTEAEIRARVLAMAIDGGAPPAWREVEGFSVVSWPNRGSVPTSLVLTGAHEMVLAPDDSLPRILAVARDHAARRNAPEDCIEPRMVARSPAEVSTVLVDMPLPARAGYPVPPQRTRVELDEGASGATVVAIHAEFSNDPEAEAAHAWATSQARAFASQPLVRMTGMNRPLETAQFALRGPALDIGAAFTVEEMRRLLGLMALQQMAR